MSSSPTSSESWSSPLITASNGSNAHTNASGHGSSGNGSGNRNGNSSRTASALAAGLVGGSSSHSLKHKGQLHEHLQAHPQSHVVQSHPNASGLHSHPPYPFPQQPLSSASQHYAHLAAVAAAAVAAAASTVSASSQAASSAISVSRSRRSAAAQLNNVQHQPPTATVPKPVRRRIHDPSAPRAEWTSDRDEVLFDVLTAVEASKPDCDKGSWSAKHWASVAKSLGERGIPGNGQQRYAVLRREWRTLCELLKKPGFTWSEAESRVTARGEVWEAHLDSLSVPFHKVAAARLRDKPYPHYQRAKALWGLATKDGPSAVMSTVRPSDALETSHSAFAIDSSRPHTPESPPTTIVFNEGSLPPGAVAAAPAAGDPSSSSHQRHLHQDHDYDHQKQHHTPERPAAAAGIHQHGLYQHQQHPLHHPSDLDFLRSPSRDDSILSAQELSDLMGSVPTPPRSESIVSPSSLTFDPTTSAPPPTLHASMVPPPLVPYPLESPSLTGPSSNMRKRPAPYPPPPTASSHPHFGHLHASAPKRHKLELPPPPFPYQPSLLHTSHANTYANGVYAPPALADPVYRALSAAAALAAAASAPASSSSASSSSSSSAPARAPSALVPDSPLDTDLAPTPDVTTSFRRLSAGSASVPGPVAHAQPSLADAMALAMAWLAGQRAGANGVDAALMLSAAHAFMQDERVLYMFLALPEDLRVVFLRQRLQGDGEASGSGVAGEVHFGYGQHDCLQE